MRSILTALQEDRLFELPSTQKDDALEFLARILDANPDIGAGTDAPEEVKQREAEYNTGIGMGVGVPHLRTRRAEGELYCAIGWSQAGIDYGAADGKPVHLVVMYYIPDAQKKIYLKEVSSLVKAIQSTGGIGPIASAENLTDVRNRLLDWVSTVGDAGPSAVARMIKLDVKQAQAQAQLAAPLAVPPAAMAGLGKVTQVLPFTVVVAGGTALVLSQDSELLTAMEGASAELVPMLAEGRPFSLGGRQVFPTGSTRYAAGRVVHQCVALSEHPMPVPAPSAPRAQ